MKRGLGSGVGCKKEVGRPVLVWFGRPGPPGSSLALLGSPSVSLAKDEYSVSDLSVTFGRKKQENLNR